MNDFLHLALLGNFGGGEIILIFLMLLFLAVPVAVVLLVVFLMKKNKNPGPDPQGPPPQPHWVKIQLLHPLRDCSHQFNRQLLPQLRQASMTRLRKAGSTSFLCMLKGSLRSLC
jgi:hypothetical protein